MKTSYCGDLIQIRVFISKNSISIHCIFLVIAKYFVKTLHKQPKVVGLAILESTTFVLIEADHIIRVVSICEL